MLNHITIHGRLTADPEFKQTQSGVSVCNFTVAVDRSYKNGEENRLIFSRLYVGEVLRIWYQNILPKVRKFLSAVKCKAENGRTTRETIASRGRLWQMQLIFAVASRTMEVILHR